MPWFILPFTDIYCITCILKISHLISCCNELKLLFSIFTLVKVKEKSKMIYVIKVCCKSHPLSSTRGGGGLFISSTFDEGGRLIEEESFVGRGGFIFNLQQNGRRPFVVQYFDERHAVFNIFKHKFQSDLTQSLWILFANLCLDWYRKKKHWSIIKSSIYFFGWEGKGGQEGAYFCVALLNKLKAF